MLDIDLDALWPGSFISTIHLTLGEQLCIIFALIAVSYRGPLRVQYVRGEPSLRHGAERRTAGDAIKDMSLIFVQFLLKI